VVAGSTVVRAPNDTIATHDCSRGHHTKTLPGNPDGWLVRAWLSDRPIVRIDHLSYQKVCTCGIIEIFVIVE
jgi:hypothetical protein